MHTGHTSYNLFYVDNYVHALIPCILCPDEETGCGGLTTGAAVCSSCSAKGSGSVASKSFGIHIASIEEFHTR